VGRNAIHINMEMATLEEVEVGMHCTPTKEGFIRLQGISFLYKGFKKEQVAVLQGVTLRAVQQWIKNFNEAGIDGVLGRKRTGRSRKIEACIFASKYKEAFLSSSGTALSFHGKLISDFEEQLCYQTFLNYLHEQGVTRIIGRPECEQRDEEKRQQFLNSFQEKVQEGAQIWFSDEAGFEGNPKPRKRWVQKGEKLKNPFYKLHLRSSVIGAANPENGNIFSHVVPFVNQEVFQNFLDDFNQTIESKDGRPIVMVLDNAAWHSDKLNWGKISPLFLPPYSPDFNPIEQIWKLLKERFFNGWYAEDLEQLDNRVCLAIKSLIENPEQVKQTASMEYLK
jgi:transposase